MTSAFDGTELLSKKHSIANFDCGVEALNSFLKNHALQNQSNSSARTFVAVRENTNEVAGFYSLCASSVDYEQTSDRIRMGLARHEVPLILLARLAVDKNCIGQGLGASLLLDSFARFLHVQETIGARAMLAHAKDDMAKAFYEKFGFVSSDVFPSHLYILSKKIRAIVQS